MLRLSFSWCKGTNFFPCVGNYFLAVQNQSLMSIEQLGRINLELKHLGGVPPVVAAFALHGDAPDVEIAPAGNLSITPSATEKARASRLRSGKA